MDRAPHRDVTSCTTPRQRPRRGALAAASLAALVAVVAAACTPPLPSWPSGTVVTVTASTSTSIDVSWPAATAASGATIASYEVSVNGVAKATTKPSKRTAHLGGLQPRTSYRVKVRAKDSNGRWSDPGIAVSKKTPGYVGLAAGDRTVSTTFGGRTRTYYLHVPAAVAASPNTPVPLVVLLHGGLGSGFQVAGSSQLSAEADAHGFVAVYPDGLLLPTAKPDLSVRTWNAGGCCNPAMSSGADDVGYVASVIDALKQTTAIDASHVVVGGHSNGAMLTWRMACERPSAMARAVVVEGALMVPSCTPSRGVDLTQIHGDADPNVPLAGGVGIGPSGTDFPSAAASQALWTAGQHCGSPTQVTAEHLTTTTWSGCAGGTTTKQIIIEGGNHAWPGTASGSPYLSATQVLVDNATS